MHRYTCRVLLVRTSCRIAQHSRIGTRCYASESKEATRRAQEAAAEVLRDASETRGRAYMPGPFPSPQQPSGQDVHPDDLRMYKEIPLKRKVRKAFRLSFSVVVVTFGGVFLTSMIVYSFSTELFAQSSPTRVFNACIPLLQQSDELHLILRQPFKFYGDPSASRMRRNRHFHSITQINPRTGREEKIVRFYIDGAIKDDPNESYLAKARATLRHLIVEPSNGVSTYDIVDLTTGKGDKNADPPTDRDKPAKEQWSWLSPAFWLGSIFPSSTKASNFESAKSIRRRPTFGAYSGGECVATMVRVADNSWRLKSLYVDFADESRIQAPYRAIILAKTDEQCAREAAEDTWQNYFHKQRKQWLG